MKKKCLHNLFLGLIVLCSFTLQGCFQDYTVEERTPVSGQLNASAEKQEVAFQFDNVSTFPDMSVRLKDWATPNRKIEVTKYDRLPILNVPGAHFELWAVSDTNQVSFGKFLQSGGELVSFVGGQTGATKCASQAGVKVCTFTMTDPNAPIFNDLDRVQVTIEPAGDADTILSGSIMASGAIINENGGIVDPLTFPVSFSQNAITATASLTLIADQAKDGLATLSLKGFPFLNNKFAYQLWSADEIGGFVSCGSFNVQNGQIVNAITLQPKASNVFTCGVDLASRTQMVISLEPVYTGNSAGIFAYQPFKATYAPFTNVGQPLPSISNVRASIAGASRDRTLTDVVGKFSLATTVQGPSYVVLRSLEFEPEFIGIDVKRGSAVGGLSKDMSPKTKGQAIFHFFEKDFGGPVSSVTVSGSFSIFPVTLTDSGENGDKFKGDGVWTAVAQGVAPGSITYNFSVNGSINFDDPHAENLDADRSTMLVK